MPHRWIHWILFLATACLAVSFALAQDSCNDVWAHALNGRIMWEMHRIPRFSDYSFVSSENVTASDNPVIELSLYGLHALFGYSGFLIFKGIFILGACGFVAIWLRDEKVGPAATATAVACMLVVAEDRFFPRADLANFTFAALFLWLLRRHELRGGKSAWLLPVILMVWRQCHVFALIGVFWVGLFWILERWRGTRGVRAYAPALGAILLACVAGVAVSEIWNPKIFKIVEWFSSGSEFRSLVETAESAPLFSSNPDFRDPVLLWKFFLPLVIVLMLFPWRRSGPWWSLLMATLTTAIAAAFFRRLMAVHAIVSVPTAAIFATQWVVPEMKANRVFAMRALAALCILALCILIWSGIYYQSQDELQVCRPVASPILKPVRGVDFILKHQIPGNVYASYNQGGYVGFRLYPFNKIYIHSLSFWYSERHLVENSQLWSGQIGLKDFACRHAISIFLLKHTENRDSAIYDRLIPLRNWPLVYLDETTAICVRQDVAATCGLKTLDLLRITAADTPVLSAFGHFWLGNFMMRQGLEEQAKGFYEMAIHDGVARPHVYNNLGVIAWRRGKSREALAYFLASLSYGGDAEARDNLHQVVSRYPDVEDPLLRTASQYTQ